MLGVIYTRSSRMPIQYRMRNASLCMYGMLVCWFWRSPLTVGRSLFEAQVRDVPVLPNCTKDLVAALCRPKVSIFVISWDTRDHNNLTPPHPGVSPLRLLHAFRLKTFYRVAQAEPEAQIFHFQ